MTNKKFIVTEEMKEMCGNVTHQIKAVRDIPRFGVKAGDLGGFIAKETNLSQDGDCWVGRGGYILDNAVVKGDVLVKGKVRDDAQVEGTVCVGYNSIVEGKGALKGDCVISEGVCCTLAGEKASFWAFSM